MERHGSLYLVSDYFQKISLLLCLEKIVLFAKYLSVNIINVFSAFSVIFLLYKDTNLLWIAFSNIKIATLKMDIIKILAGVT